MIKSELINSPIQNLFNRKNPLLWVDTRSLSLFRIILGFSILYNLVVIKLSYIHELIGSHALFTVEEWKFLNGFNALNFFYFYHEDWFVSLILGLTIILAIAYTIGFYSRLVSIMLFILLYNIQSSISAFIYGYDFYTQHLLFFSLFLPLDNHFSLLKKLNIQSNQVKVDFYFSILILFQICLVYFNTGIVKSGISWHQGFATKMMSMDLWNSRFLSSFLANNDWISYPLNYFTLIFECLAPVLIFVPIKRYLGRYLFILILVLFHISVFFTLDVANFSITGIAAAALLLPSNFWSNNLFSIQPSNHIQSFGKLSKYWMILVITLCMYKSIFFYLQWGPFRKEQWNYNIYKSLSAYNVQNPLKLSFLTQNWKMFSPNPPVRVGWFTIEEIRDDELLYDFFTNDLVNPNENILRYKPTGMLMQILSNSREYDYDDCWRQRMFLKKWIERNLISKYGNDYKSRRVFFADYQYNLKINQAPIHDKKVDKKLLTINAIMNLPIKVASEDTIQRP